MLESDSFDPLLLDAKVKPLPWTKGGPNEDSMQQQPTANLINSSVADPIFTIKNRGISDVLGPKTLAMVKQYAHLSEEHTSYVVERMNQQFSLNAADKQADEIQLLIIGFF